MRRCDMPKLRARYPHLNTFAGQSARNIGRIFGPGDRGNVLSVTLYRIPNLLRYTRSPPAARHQPRMIYRDWQDLQLEKPHSQLVLEQFLDNGC
jgi:hypothetical protein